MAAYACICIALVLLLAQSLWNAYHDLQLLRSTIVRTDADHVRSRADRIVGRIEQEVASRGLEATIGSAPWEWLHGTAGQLLIDEPSISYVALVDANGLVRWHNNAEKVGLRLPRGWYDRRFPEAGEGVFESDSDELGGGERVLDVSLPIDLGTAEAGEFHVGVALARLEERYGQQRNAMLRRHALSVGFVMLIVLAAATSLYYIATHSVLLRQAVKSAHVARSAEVSRLAAGLAHEIRNPLHAIRLNLHTLQHARKGEANLPPEEVDKIVSESNREIERIDGLMRELVGFAAPNEPRPEQIHLQSELQAVIDFLSQEMRNKQVDIRTRFTAIPVYVTMDAGRLRQIMLNLLQNAGDALPAGGAIEVAVSADRDKAEIIVADNGPGVEQLDRERIFEPFFTSKANGTGLGLALVSRFVSECGGDIVCEKSPSGGASFRITLQRAS